MARDSTSTYLHQHASHHADLLESFTNSASNALPSEDIALPASQQLPPNPEDEDDVVPDQHAAFGIARANAGERGAGWRDLGLADLMEGGPKGKEGGWLRGRGALPR